MDGMSQGANSHFLSKEHSISCPCRLFGSKSAVEPSLGTSVIAPVQCVNSPNEGGSRWGEEEQEIFAIC